MYKSKTRINVRYAETDKMAIVHHSNYYVYFEAAREDFIKGCGVTYPEIEAMGIMMPLLETYCKYKEGAKYGDALIVETTIEELTPVKIILKYTVINEATGKVISTGRTIQAFVDSENFKVINLRRKNPVLWNRIEKLTD